MGDDSETVTDHEKSTKVEEDKRKSDDIKGDLSEQASVGGFVDEFYQETKEKIESFAEKYISGASDEKPSDTSNKETKSSETEVEQEPILKSEIEDDKINSDEKSPIFDEKMSVEAVAEAEASPEKTN